MGPSNSTFSGPLAIPTTLRSIQRISRPHSEVKDSLVKLKDLKADLMDDPRLQSEYASELGIKRVNIE